MSNYPQFSLAFNIANSNKERSKAFDLYEKAFNAKKLSESYPPDGQDLHIMMEINKFKILLAPGDAKPMNNIVTCQIQFDSEEDLRRAYDILIEEGWNYWIGSYPWARVGAHVTDKYSVSWWLHL
ncbi:MAG: hypothetical protein R3232_00710 [Clostridia bacterium]|nr:hypothetical protein [Clostridia bacterium]